MEPTRTIFDVDAVVQMHASAIAAWHCDGVHNSHEGFLNIVCEQLKFNYLLWHEEDKARSKTATNNEIADVKRAIDRLNQQRNDWMEKIDDWVAEWLVGEEVAPSNDAIHNSESVGAIIDRLSILALRIYHLNEVVGCPSSSIKQRDEAAQRLAIAAEQHQDLAVALRQLLHDLLSGLKRHKIYRQLKLYNNPLFNQYLADRSG